MESNPLPLLSASDVTVTPSVFSPSRCCHHSCFCHFTVEVWPARKADPGPVLSSAHCDLSQGSSLKWQVPFLIWLACAGSCCPLHASATIPKSLTLYKSFPLCRRQRVQDPGAGDACPISQKNLRLGKVRWPLQPCSWLAEDLRVLSGLLGSIPQKSGVLGLRASSIPEKDISRKVALRTGRVPLNVKYIPCEWS